MRKRIDGLELLVAIVMVVLVPVWLSVPVLAGLVLYRRRRQQESNES